MDEKIETPSVEETPNKNRNLIIGAIVAIVLCCCCVAGVIVSYQYLGDMFLELVGLQ